MFYMFFIRILNCTVCNIRINKSIALCASALARARARRVGNSARKYSYFSWKHIIKTSNIYARAVRQAEQIGKQSTK